MGLETGTFLDDLVTSNPDGATDDMNKGDDHLRLIKSVLKATFPNATRAFRFESVLTKTTTYPVVAADARALILADASSGVFTITLPLGSTVFAGYSVIIMKSDSGSNAVTVDGNGAETINGSATRTLSVQYQGEKYAWDGSEWKVIAFAKVGTSNLINDSVTFAKMQNITTARLLGRTTASSGDTEEITVDATMDFSSLTLGVKDAGIDTTQLAALAVTTAKIAANAVDGSKIALGSDAQGDIMYYDGSNWVRLAKSANGEVLLLASGIPAWGAPGGQLLHVRDEKTSGTSGGGFTSGAWRKRTLNTTLTNEITGASLASSVITLPAGTFWIEATAPAGNVNTHTAKLRNTADNSDVLIGSTGAGERPSDPSNTHSFVFGRFTLAASKTLEFQHRCQTTNASVGFGAGASFSVTNVYADVKIWKVG